MFHKLSRKANLITPSDTELFSLLQNKHSSLFKENFIITLYNVCSVHRGMFSTLGGAQYIGWCSVHRGDIMSTLGDIMSTLGMFSTSGGYHDECGGIQ